MKRTSFKKSEQWYIFTTYSIKEIDGEKYIIFHNEQDRIANGKSYLSWVAYYHCDKKMKLEDFLEWDVYYQREKLLGDYSNNYYEYKSPEEAFEEANYFIKGEDFSGSEQLDLVKLTMDTPVGQYYE